MKKITYIFSLIFIAGLISCDDEQLFKTTEVTAPTVTATNWSVSAIDAGGTTVSTVGFADGGRIFRLPGPNNDSTSTAYKDINIQTVLNSGDARTIDSVAVSFRWILAFPSNAAQPWTFNEGISIPAADRSSSYNFDYNWNLDEWMDDYACINYITGAPDCGFADWTSIAGAFGLNITRDDNLMRLELHFSDGSVETIAQVQFSLPRTEAGLN